jgi:hypothetical protein
MKTEVTNMARQILEGVGEEDNQRKGKRGKGKGGRAGVRDQGKGGRISLARRAGAPWKALTGIGLERKFFSQCLSS